MALSASSDSISASASSLSEWIDASVACLDAAAETSASRLARQPIAERALLGCAHLDQAGFLGDPGSCADRLRAQPRQPLLRALDLHRDPLVLATDAVQQLDVVEQVGEGGRAESEREDVGRVGLVDLPHAALEPLDGDSVLAREGGKPLGLVVEQHVQARQPAHEK